MAARPLTPKDSAIAFRRFGLGPKPGEIAKISADPRSFVLSQLTDSARARIPSSPDLESSPQVFASLEEARIEQAIVRAFGGGKADAQAAQAAPAAAKTAMAPAEKVGGEPAMTLPASGKTTAAVPPAANGPVGKLRREALREETAARITRAIATDTPFLERLVYFWSNHFCVSVTKGPVRALAGSYEREAIRPHILGRFGDMLKAVEQHPAMLIYLDNIQSIGPNSPAGIGRDKGLNENLAREILELHTLGVDGGYTQADVTNFARIITGWTYGQGDMVTEADRGRFIYTPNRHEPGVFQVLNKSYPQPGKAAGEAVLADLAHHAATARHIARKLARHFVSDTPPPALVARLEKTFRDTGGDLAAVTRALVQSDEAWDAPAAKIVPPFDFTVGLVRGFDLKTPPPEINRLAAVLGQPLWQVPSPNGFPDADDSWMGPSPVRERLRIAEMIAKSLPKSTDPRLVLADLAGPGVSEHTKLAVQRAETREQAYELMIMSPDFMRR
jgi:uncharacterized protein (DUF1800 family)